MVQNVNKIWKIRKSSILRRGHFYCKQNSGSRIEDLGKLCNLRGEFIITGLENVVNGENASMARMRSKEHIKKLTLEWMGDTGDSQLAQVVLENLQPHSNLEDFKIKGYCGIRFPNWLEDPSFSNVVFLCLFNCKRCLRLPALGQLPCLKHLTIEGLSKVSEIGQEFYGDTSLVKSFSCLKVLRIENMCELREWQLSESEVFSCLEELHIVDCPKLTGKIRKQLPSLRTLKIYNCPGLVNSDGKLSIATMPNLNRLDMGDQTIRTCHVSFEGLCGSGNRDSTSGSITNLSLDSFPTLGSLVLQWCDNFMSFPVGGLHAPNLTHIHLFRCPKLKSLPEKMHTLLPSLRELRVWACPEIECFPEGGLPSSLWSLQIGECKRLWSCRREWGLRRLPSLTSLEIGAMGHEENTFPPDDLLLPCTLRNLYLEMFSNLETLNGGVLQHLTRLERLYISSCPKLKSLPEEGLPTSLSKLYIWYCPLLKQRLQWGRGEDWPKVEHIACISVDDELIS